ncbi:hypothetical protein DK842_14165 [Chromobacterium phragmitis]|uniref:Uncharacterized protein n=1 Tax=Chromobacterium phragmitis TaxID=2202141 RepID=A0A344UM28_9NEIS|nr:hypothetical protein [Chromobacterium phragmitis]AXE30929.1 hypothetical protein DK842_14165 [Chromobacterium phragmitis]AXE36326.1 hypothetical protein DK843_19735 [Chromobacterium phragmitis]
MSLNPLPVILGLLCLPLSACGPDGDGATHVSEPRRLSASSDHFWRKREIEEVSRRIIEKELGYPETTRLIAQEDGTGSGQYRFRLSGTTRNGWKTQRVTFAVQGDLASGRVLSIHCHARDGSRQACYPSRPLAAWS